APAARAQSLECLSGQSPVGLVAQVVEEQLVDQALDGDVELGHLGGGLDLFRHGHELDAVSLQASVQPQGFNQVPGDPGEIVDQDDGKGWRNGQGRGDQALVSGPMVNSYA